MSSPFRHQPLALSHLQLYAVAALVKSPARIPDEGSLFDTYTDSWVVLVDKDYVGHSAAVRAIHPSVKPPRLSLTQTQEAEHRRISSDRIIVENVFDYVPNGQFAQISFTETGVCMHRYFAPA